MVPAGTDAPPPNMSLAKWGFDVPVKLDKRFKKAQRLMEAKRFAEANRELRGLLDDVVRIKYKIGITAYMHVVLLIAYNHADQQEYAEGLKLYEHRERLIKQEGDRWGEGMPDGLNILVRESFYEERDAMLAFNYLEIGIASAHLGHLERAVNSYSLGARHALRAGNREQAVLHCRYLARLAERVEDGAMMKYAGELFEEVSGGDEELQRHAAYLKFQGSVLAQKLHEAFGYAEQLLELTTDPEQREQFQGVVDELKTVLGQD